MILKVLPEEASGTVVVADGEIADLGPASRGRPLRLRTERARHRGANPPGRARAGPFASRRTPALRPGLPPSPRAPYRLPRGLGRIAGRGTGRRRRERGPTRFPIRAASASPRPAAGGRPLTVTLLAGPLARLYLHIWRPGRPCPGARPERHRGGRQRRPRVPCSAVVSGLMAWGLFTRKPWARLAQAVIAGLGLLVCPFTLASATTLIYVLRPSTRAAFDPERDGARRPGRDDVRPHPHRHRGRSARAFARRPSWPRASCASPSASSGPSSRGSRAAAAPARPREAGAADAPLGAARPTASSHAPCTSRQ